MVLYKGPEFVRGRPEDTTLDTYAPLRMADLSDIEIGFMPSTEVPVGLGEPATTTVIAPAIGNAIFAAIGVRLSDLPIRPDAVRRALANQS